MTTISLPSSEQSIIDDIRSLNIEITNDNFEHYYQDILDGRLNSVIFKLKNPEILNGLIFVNVKVLIFDSYAHLSKIAFSFPNVRHLQLWNVKGKTDLSCLNELPNCNKLDLFKTTFFTRISLPNITELYINTIRFDEHQLFNLPSLKYLSLGSTQNAHNAGLGYLSELRLLVLGWEKSGTENLNELSNLSKFQGLYTFRASQLQKLPSFKNSVNFKAASIMESHQLTDVTGLYEAPNLEILCIIHCKSLQEDAFYPLQGHPTLKKIYIGTTDRSQKKLMNYFEDIWDESLLNFEYVLPDLK
jgi:hypothetical protein